MVIKSTTQIFNQEFLSKEVYDLILVSSGYEERCTFLANELKPNSSNKVALVFDSSDSTTLRKANEKIFKRHKYELVPADGDQEKAVIDIINRITAQKQESDSLKILVDYSSMTRIWYACLLKYFWLKKHHFTSVKIDFFYSYAKYTPGKKENTKNIHIGPIESFTNYSLPSKETALIVGLGYEKNKAFGLTEYFDATTFYFINDLSKGAEYTADVVDANEQLLKSTKNDKVFFYPINDMAYTENLLCSLCQSLAQDYKIVIAPCGPKPFTLLSLISAIKTELIDVWRISPGKIAAPINRVHDGTYSLYRVQFSQDLVSTMNSKQLIEGAINP